MLTTGVAALCGLIVGWGIRSMRQAPTAQQGASDEVLEQIQAWCDHMVDLGLCPEHLGEFELTVECSLHPFQRLALLMDLATVQAKCPDCCSRGVHRGTDPCLYS